MQNFIVAAGTLLYGEQETFFISPETMISGEHVAVSGSSRNSRNLNK